MLLSTALFLSPLFLSAAASPIEPRADPAPVKETNCNGKSYVYEELAGFGIFPGDARDKFGDTIGGVGSSIALDKKSWKKKEGKDEAYTGILYGLPDRGWNTQGTQNTASRIQKFGVTLTIVDATVAKPAKPNFVMEYLDTIILKGPDGTPTTGLDADATGHISFPGFPDLPGATYTGDGFGGAGPGGKRISLDAEGLVLGDDDTFWVSDEYGPYVYQFDNSGKMIQAIRPVDALIPMRNGAESFSANSPPIFDASRKVTPGNPDTGRQNNQGFEGLTVSPDGKTLYVLLQSAARQEGGAAALTRRHTRFLQYDISKKTAKYEAEYVVELPVISNGKIAAQSEVHFISDSQFLILARDSGAGHGQSSSTSLYRNADIFDISKATDIKSATNDKFNGAIANSATGVLNAGITPAAYCPWIEFNNNSELNKFGAHNGGAQDAFLLNEKWEGLALAPVAGKFSDNGNKDGEEYYLISLSDNDFITQNGFINGGQIPFKDASGFNLDTQALVFKVRLPKGAKPLEG
ncbi:outer membrane autotransporter [Clohesyomyces aquaticus]|uniref:Outer membrane autotransporter n=1 Tax=Clohesyomyces aquaticus TaxID=1231657 RepID=A0A1Y2A5Q3_9PLEO|nr:outer membrane autotransporter [Clohesyomyces aquaticus]